LSGAWPAHWTAASVADLLSEPLRNGHSARAAGGAGGVRTLTLTAVTQGDFSERNTKLTSADPARVADLWLRPGDLLVERSNTPELVGTARLYRGPADYAVFPDLLIRARLVDGIDAGFVEAFLATHTARSYFRKAAQGIAGSMPKISQPTIERLEVPVAPQPEQRRIVEALESYLTRLDAAVATLERVHRNLKRYRASVLKAAVEGRLVPTEAELSRAEGRDYEPASALLERILAERRRRWEEAELARLKARRGIPKEDMWRVRYGEPPKADASGLPCLPEGWCWARLEELLSVPLANGRSVKTAAVGFPVLRLTALKDGDIDIGERKIGEWTEGEASPFLVREGDFLVARGNGSVRLVGTGGLVRTAPDPIAYPDTLIRVRLNAGVDPEWFAHIWHSESLRRQIEEKAKTTAGIFKVNQSDLEGCVVPIPPFAEQQRIRIELDRVRTHATVATNAARDSTTHCQRLRQAILKWAFEGKLVEQDPNDEPAAVLLERIRAARGAADETASFRRKGGARRKRSPSSC